MKVSDYRRLARTTAVRTGLRYALVYALLAGAALGAFYWTTARYVDAQLYAGLRSDFELLRSRYEDRGSIALMELLESRSASAEEEGRYYLLVDADDNMIAGNLLGLPPEDPLPLDGRVHVAWVEDDIIPGNHYEDDAWWPVIGTELADGSRLVVARSVRQAEALQTYSLYSLTVLLLVIVALALAMGVFMGRTILSRIDRITDTADGIMTGNLAKRMPVSTRGDEFDALSERLNRMLERIEQLVQGMREVTDNVAHDLRSPLTRLRNRLEVTLLEPRDAAEYRDAMKQAIEDAESLMKTFNAILQVSQAKAGTVRADLAPLDIAALVRESAELYAPVIEEAGLQLHVDADGPVMVRGNRNLVAQAVGNLLDNAIKYTPAGGRITLRAMRSGQHAEICVTDTGPGIPRQDRHRVTERYARLDSARSTPGNGLGLSIVDAIAHQLGAELLLEDNKPGLRAVIRFPSPSGPGKAGTGAGREAR